MGTCYSTKGYETSMRRTMATNNHNNKGKHKSAYSSGPGAFGFRHSTSQGASKQGAQKGDIVIANNGTDLPVSVQQGKGNSIPAPGRFGFGYRPQQKSVELEKEKNAEEGLVTSESRSNQNGPKSNLQYNKTPAGKDLTEDANQNTELPKSSIPASAKPLSSSQSSLVKTGSKLQGPSTYSKPKAEIDRKNSENLLAKQSQAKHLSQGKHISKLKPPLSSNKTESKSEKNAKVATKSLKYTPAIDDVQKPRGGITAARKLQYQKVPETGSKVITQEESQKTKTLTADKESKIHKEPSQTELKIKKEHQDKKESEKIQNGNKTEDVLETGDKENAKNAFDNREKSKSLDNKHSNAYIRGISRLRRESGGSQKRHSFGSPGSKRSSFKNAPLAKFDSNNTSLGNFSYGSGSSLDSEDLMLTTDLSLESDSLHQKEDRDIGTHIRSSTPDGAVPSDNHNTLANHCEMSRISRVSDAAGIPVVSDQVTNMGAETDINADDESSRIARYNGGTSTPPRISTPSKGLKPSKLVTNGSVAVQNGVSEELAIDHDSEAYRNTILQDMTSVKTMLLKLKRVLHESEDLEYAQNLKNGYCQIPSGVSMNQHNEEMASQVQALKQENADLRKQLQQMHQQLEEKDRSLRQLSQQMQTNQSPSSQSRHQVQTNATTQTEKFRIPVDKKLLRSASDCTSTASGAKVISSVNEALEVLLQSSSKGASRMKQQMNKVEKSLGTIQEDLRSKSAIYKAKSSYDIRRTSSSNSELSDSSLCHSQSLENISDGNLKLNNSGLLETDF